MLVRSFVRVMFENSSELSSAQGAKYALGFTVLMCGA